MPLHKNTSEKNDNPKMWNDSVQEKVCDMLYFLYGLQEFSSHNKSHAKWQITKKKLGRVAKDENVFFSPHEKVIF